MVYTRFVEAGRVALVNNGKYDGQLVVIADIIDQKRLLCENPTHKIPRHVLRVQDINLTDLKIKIPVGARGKAIRKQYETDEIDNKWNSTAWAQRLKSRGLKKTLSDFDRFKAKIQKQRTNRKIKAALKTMKKK